MNLENTQKNRPQQFLGSNFVQGLREGNLKVLSEASKILRKSKVFRDFVRNYRLFKNKVYLKTCI